MWRERAQAIAELVAASRHHTGAIGKIRLEIEMLYKRVGALEHQVQRHEREWERRQLLWSKGGQ